MQDPYRVWLSEIMLQQTTVAAVKPYYESFVRRWPDIQSLAAAPEEDVLAAWAGLGYYSRARNLVACARVVAEAGAFPQDEQALRKLPGIGNYTAAAIAAIAFGKRAVVVDANVTRVVSRLYAIDEPLPKSARQVYAHADQITPSDRAGDFAQAMMDLGAIVCTARSPSCDLCPLKTGCRACSGGYPAIYPVKAPKKPKPDRTGNIWWIEREGAVLLVQRPDRGMLARMRALPDNGWSAAHNGGGTPPLAGNWQDAGYIHHSFTHFNLTARVQVLENCPRWHPEQGVWWPVTQLAEAGLPSLFDKAAQRVLASGLSPSQSGEE